MCIIGHFNCIKTPKAPIYPIQPIKGGKKLHREKNLGNVLFYRSKKKSSGQ